MLLTGDARGDKIIENLEEHGLMDDEGKIHVDLLKMPHHGSDRNVEDDFFKRVTADHYVVSGDGRHHNPELETYRMLFKARQGAIPTSSTSPIHRRNWSRTIRRRNWKTCWTKPRRQVPSFACAIRKMARIR